MAGDPNNDTVLSIVGAAITFLTFAYGLIIGFIVLLVQLRHASEHIKQFAKKVANLRRRILELPRMEAPTNQPPYGGVPVGVGVGTGVDPRDVAALGRTGYVLDALRTPNFAAEPAAATLRVRLRALHKDSWKLFGRTRDLAPAYFNYWPEDPEGGDLPNWDGLVRLRDKLKWIWSETEHRMALEDVLRDFEEVRSLLQDREKDMGGNRERNLQSYQEGYREGRRRAASLERHREENRARATRTRFAGRDSEDDTRYSSQPQTFEKKPRQSSGVSPSREERPRSGESDRDSDLRFVAEVARERYDDDENRE